MGSGREGEKGVHVRLERERKKRMRECEKELNALNFSSRWRIKIAQIVALASNPTTSNYFPEHV